MPRTPEQSRRNGLRGKRNSPWSRGPHVKTQENRDRHNQLKGKKDAEETV
jgi:hypothetical protein